MKTPRLAQICLTLLLIPLQSACLKSEVKISEIVDPPSTDMSLDGALSESDQNIPDQMLTSVVCGNGVVEEGESCDGSDDCDERCQLCDGVATTRCEDQEIYRFDACARRREFIETCSEEQRCTLSAEGARCTCSSTEDQRCNNGSIYAVNSCDELERNPIETCSPNQECVESLNEQSGVRSASCECLPAVTSYCEEDAVIVVDACGTLSPPTPCEESFRCEESNGYASCRPLTPCAVQNTCPFIEWVRIEGGRYMMGSEDFSDALPIHEVTLQSFEIMKTEVTVGQYQTCVDAGVCEPPNCDQDSRQCTYAYVSEEASDIPVSYMTWHMLNQFAAWVGARLLTEAEWEYAARNRGTVQNFPWEGRISCDLALYSNCASSHAPSCSRPLGNTAQGVCDLHGSTWEWVQDEYFGSYTGAPSDGSGWCTGPCPLNADSEEYNPNNNTYRVLRGPGLFSSYSPSSVRRLSFSSSNHKVGGRLARDL